MSAKPIQIGDCVKTDAADIAPSDRFRRPAVRLVTTRPGAEAVAALSHVKRSCPFACSPPSVHNYYAESSLSQSYGMSTASTA